MSRGSEGEKNDKALVQAQLDEQIKTIEGADDDDMRVFNEIRAGLEGEKQECFPGAPPFFGVQFVKINNWENNCGFNPLFYVVLFVFIGVITLAVSYSGED